MHSILFNLLIFDETSDLKITIGSTAAALTAKPISQQHKAASVKKENNTVQLVINQDREEIEPAIR